jgi:hypothetical protein
MRGKRGRTSGWTGKKCFNLWANNRFIVTVLLSDADKKTISPCDVSFCESSAGIAAQTHSPCSKAVHRSTGGKK